MKKLTLAFLTLMLAVYAGGILAADTPIVTATTPAPIKYVKKVVDTTCIRTVVEARETGIRNAYQKMSGEITQALNARGNDLSIAWSNADAKIRTKAINAAWAKYKTARKNSIKNYRTTIDNLWKTYKTSAKNCKINNKAIDTKVEETKTNGVGIDRALE